VKHQEKVDQLEGEGSVPSIVGLSSGEKRHENVKRALELIEPELESALEGKKSILIKPNFVSTKRQAAASHVDAARAVLDVVRGMSKADITIAEGAAQIPTSQGFTNFGFERLAKEYGANLVDLNTDRYVEIDLYDRNLKPLTFRISKTVLDSDFRVSLALPKTHDTVVVTLAIKNLAVGSLLKDANGDEMMKLHQGTRSINMSIAKLAEAAPASLAVLDGWEGMEGEGPELGEPVRLGWAMAGLDALAVDTLATHLMGFGPALIGYLVMCRERGLGEGDLRRIDVRGVKDYRTLRKDLKRHPTYEKQLDWR
jgi:uncharacterized protein (DUF362 family)